MEGHLYKRMQGDEMPSLHPYISANGEHTRVTYKVGLSTVVASTHIQSLTPL